jgi:hypothetical protein
MRQLNTGKNFTERQASMAGVQKQFEEFHKAIRLDENDENARLREKRDTLIKDLKNRLPDDAPAFEYFHQGSYSMNTGTCPPDGNHDIDIGIVFDCKKDKYEDPVVLKQIVRDALNYGNRSVVIRRPCVTVNYVVDGKTAYHVDLAIYANRDDGKLDIAMGKEFSDSSKRVWQVAEPQRLTGLVNDRFSGDEAAQFRRCVRYFKRWRDVQFSNGGSPLSIALTVAAYRWFQAQKDYITGKYVDLAAMRVLAKAMLDQFVSVLGENGQYVSRLAVTLPVDPYSDLMSKLSDSQMGMFKEKLQSLYDALVEAFEETLPEDACKILRKHFGDEFPVPAKEETAKAVSAPYVSTGSSA